MSDDTVPISLHVTVRDTLADANPAVKAMWSAILQRSPDSAFSDVGPAPLRRLCAFYAEGWSSGFTEKQIRADLSWVTDHLAQWVRQQEQAQQDAHSLLQALHEAFPLPAAVDVRGVDVPLHERARALRRTPQHWLHQPWAQRLMARWTEDLRDAVVDARHWLDEHTVELDGQYVGIRPASQ